MATRNLRKPGAESLALIERVDSHELPETAIELINEYETTVGDREEFLWKWAHHLFPTFTLSSVPSEHVERLQNHKLVGLMFVSVLDDTAEKHGDLATFEEAAKIPFDHRTVNTERNGVNREVVEFANELWDRLKPAFYGAPRSAEFEDILRFDLKQVLNAMDYSFVANQNLEFMTGSELQTYDAHNMMLFAFAGIDLVHSPGFDRLELSRLRRVIKRAQRMVRIGNWITTWERELYEGDFTSGIVAYALENSIVSPDELRKLRSDDDAGSVEQTAELIRDHAIEEAFLRQWQDELDAAREYETDVDSVDVGAYLDGIESVMDYHLASRGLK